MQLPFTKALLVGLSFTITTFLWAGSHGDDSATPDTETHSGRYAQTGKKENIPSEKVKSIKANKDGALIFELKAGGTLTVSGEGLPKDMTNEESETGNHFASLSYDKETGEGKILYMVCGNGSCKPTNKKVKVK